MRDISRCELFSKLVGGNIPCSYPKKEKCSFKFYADKTGILMGLCANRVKALGFLKCWAEMCVLCEWAIRVGRKIDVELVKTNKTKKQKKCWDGNDNDEEEY